MHLDDPDLQVLLASQLVPGERILWVGRPGRGGPARRAVRAAWLLIRATPFALFLLAFAVSQAGAETPAVARIWLPMVVAMLLAGICIASAMERRRWYVLTDRRAFSLSLAARPFVLHCCHGLAPVRCARRKDGSGDLVFGGTAFADGDARELGEPLAFYGIPDVGHVERLLAERPGDAPVPAPGTPEALPQSQVAQHMAGWLYSRQGMRRTAAMTHLARMGLPAVPVLVRALGDRDSGVRALAAEALSRVAGKHRLPPEAIGALVVAAHDESEPVWRATRKALASVGKAAVVPLIRRPPAPTGWRRPAMAALDLVGEQAFGEGVLDGLAAGDERVLAELRHEFLGGSDLPRVVVRAWSSLGPASVEPLLAVLKRCPEWAGVAAAEALAACCDPGVRERITTLSRPVLQSPGMAEAVASEVAHTTAEVRGRLRALLGADQQTTRISAAVGLGFLGDARATPYLTPALYDAKRWVRSAVVRALGYLESGAISALPPLEALLRREADADICYHCQQAIGRIKAAMRAAPAELEAASAPAGRGTEPESAPPIAGRGTELAQGEPPAEPGREGRTGRGRA